jgi:hypothetical protein
MQWGLKWLAPCSKWSEPMRDTDVFQLALGLASPWMVTECNFDGEARRLDIKVDFANGGRFACPSCGKTDCLVHDTVMQTWRHRDFFKHRALLHARTPRVMCFDCGVEPVAVPWGRVSSGFVRLSPGARCQLLVGGIKDFVRVTRLNWRGRFDPRYGDSRLPDRGDGLRQVWRR